MKFTIEVEYWHEGRRITQRWEPPIPEEAVITAIEARADNEGIVRTPFAFHGYGYHTLCHDNPEHYARILMLRYGGYPT